MMLTKEECENLLSETKIYLKNQMLKKERISHSVYLLNTITSLLEKLIQEHFENPPLKFEELKEGMWVWDNYWEEYFEISEVYSNTKEIDVLVHQNKINQKRYETIKYTPNRFYRKEVQE